MNKKLICLIIFYAVFLIFLFALKYFGIFTWGAIIGLAIFTIPAAILIACLAILIQIFIEKVIKIIKKR